MRALPFHHTDTFDRMLIAQAEPVFNRINLREVGCGGLTDSKRIEKRTK